MKRNFRMEETTAHKSVAVSVGRSVRWAVFDFDGTLIRHDSMWRYFRHVNGVLRFAVKFLRATPWIMAYFMKLRDSSECKLGAINAFIGTLPSEKLENRASGFATWLQVDMRPGASEYLRLLKDNGFRIALCTASASLWVESWARQAGFDSLIATQLVRGADGMFQYSTPNCKNEEKVRRLREAGILRPGNYTEAYGDSPLDVPMFRAANRSFLNPDFPTLLSRADLSERS